MPLPVVSVTPPSQTIFVGSSPTFICTVEFDETVDIPVEVTILSALGTVTGIPIDDVQMESYMLYKQKFTPESVKASNSGQAYECRTVGGVLVSNSPYVLAQDMDASDNVTVSICKPLLNTCDSS